MSYVLELFDKCLTECDDEERTQTRPLQQLYKASVKNCTKKYEAGDKDILLECLRSNVNKPLNGYEHGHNCFDRCKTNAVSRYKYDLRVSGSKASVRTNQRKIQKLIDIEADAQLGLFAQLYDILVQDTDLSEKEASKEILAIFNNNFDNWLSNAECLEVALNEIIDDVKGLVPDEIAGEFAEIPNHCNFKEAELLRNPSGKKMGRDNIVKAIWRTMKARLELNYMKDFGDIQVTDNPSFKDAWDTNWDLRNPFNESERLMQRHRVKSGTHRDGTDIWKFEYFPSDEIEEIDGYLIHDDQNGYYNQNWFYNMFDAVLEEKYVNIHGMDSLYELIDKIESEEDFDSTHPSMYGVSGLHFTFYDPKKLTMENVYAKAINIILENISDKMGLHNKAFPKALMDFAGRKEISFKEAEKAVKLLSELDQYKVVKISEILDSIDSGEPFSLKDAEKHLVGSSELEEYRKLVESNRLRILIQEGKMKELTHFIGIDSLNCENIPLKKLNNFEIKECEQKGKIKPLTEFLEKYDLKL